MLIAILNWQRWIAQVLEMEVAAGEFARSQMIPALNKKGYMGRAFREQHPVGETSILVDDELVGIVSKRAYQAESILRVIEIVRESASELLSAIEKAQKQ